MQQPYLVWPEPQLAAGKGVALPGGLPGLRHVDVQQRRKHALDARLLQHAARHTVGCSGRAIGA